MESEKVKEIKKVLEEGQFNTINHHQHEGEPILIMFADILTLINELESENSKLKQHKRELEGGQRDLLKVIKEFDKETQQLKDRIAELEKENEILRKAKTIDDNVANEMVNLLKQFAGRLIAKKVKLGDRFNIYDIDETLKEFINE